MTEPANGRMSNQDIAAAIDRAQEDLRREISAQGTAFGVQIGAVEKLMAAELNGLRNWVKAVMGVVALDVVVRGTSGASIPSAVVVLFRHIF